MTHRFYRPQHHAQIVEGVVWERTKGRHEPVVKIVRVYVTRLGERILLEGVQSGRQWHVNTSTLLDAYKPKEKQ